MITQMQLQYSTFFNVHWKTAYTKPYPGPSKMSSAKLDTKVLQSSLAYLSLMGKQKELAYVLAFVPVPESA